MSKAYPSTQEEIAAAIADPEFANETFASPESMTEWVNGVVNAARDADKGMTERQIKEQTAVIFQDMLRENGVGRPPVGVTPDNVSRPATHNKKALGASLDGKFDSMGEFFQTTWHNTAPSDRVNELRTDIRNASSTVPSEGGFLVPEEFRADVLSLSLETGIVRPRAQVVPMATNRLKYPTIDDTSHTSSVMGGFTAEWTDEGAEIGESDAKFGTIALDAKKLSMYTEAPNELIADSAISFDAFVRNSLPQVVSYFEDDAFLVGNGAGRPLGVLNTGNAASVAVAKETGQPADTIAWENLAKMYARMLPSSLPRAVWVANIETFPELATMALSVGTGGSAIWINNGAEGPPMTILGRPVLFTEKASALGDLGDINFIDFGYYLIGDRQMMTVDSSPHYKFRNDKTSFRITSRVDGRPWLQSALTPRKGAATLSPFVKLAARA